MHHALELYEVQSAIATYLEHHHLALCLRVSKRWHTTFLPVLWRSIELHGSICLKPRCPPLTEFQKHGHLIQELILFHLVSQEYLVATMNTPQQQEQIQGQTPERPFPRRLQRLSILCNTADLKSWSLEYQATVAALIRDQGDTLNQIIYTSCGSLSVENALWEVMTKHKRVRLLDLTSIHAPRLDFKRFWNAARTVQELKLFRVEFQSGVDEKVLQDVDDHDFHSTCSEIKTLDIHEPRSGGGPKILWMMRQSPLLTSLTVDCMTRGTLAVQKQQEEFFPVQEFIFSIHQQRMWRDLTRFSVSDMDLTDLDLALILKSMSTVLQFGCSGSGFGALAFEALKRGGRFETIQDLELRRCPAVTGGMIREVLESCPRLIRFCTSRITAKDILTHTDKPWKSAGTMRDLEMDVIMTLSTVNMEDYADDATFLEAMTQARLENRAVLERLSLFSRLEYLDLAREDDGGGDKDENDGDDEDPDERVEDQERKRKGLGYLKFTGEDGLGVLTTLKRLEWIELPMAQEISMTDYKWMVQHWPLLEAMHGRVDHDYQERIAWEKERGLYVNVFS